MRSFTFDVLVRYSASGNHRTVDGVNYIRLARDLARAGRVTLVLNRSEFAGYGGSRDVGYNRFNYTVTEVPGAFSA